MPSQSAPAASGAGNVGRVHLDAQRSTKKVPFSRECGLADSHAKELLSRAHLSAIAAQAGLAQSTDNVDYGVDVRLLSSRKNSVCRSYFLAVQIKARRAVLTTQGWKLRLTRDDIDRVLDDFGSALIVLYVLPNSIFDWAKVDGQGTILRECAYYLDRESLETQKLGKGKSVTVFVSDKSVLDARSLLAIFRKGRETMMRRLTKGGQQP
jgi:hypothetical protein